MECIGARIGIVSLCIFVFLTHDVIQTPPYRYDAIHVGYTADTLTIHTGYVYGENSPRYMGKTALRPRSTDTRTRVTVRGK